MAIQTEPALLTAAEFAKLPEPETAVRQELIDGELVEMPPATLLHYKLRFRLRDLLARAAAGYGVVGIEMAYRPAPEHQVLIADVAFLTQARWDVVEADVSTYLAGSPELVIEVLSPSNTASEMLRREQLTLEGGCLEFWVVDPKRQVVRVTTREGRITSYTHGLIPLSMLGNASLNVADIFSI